VRVLIANDDGLASPGIALLANAAQALASEIWIVAPARKWTAASHQVSFDRDIVLTRRRERVYECDGAPADCVIGALTALWPQRTLPDLVLAGINDQRNVAEDVAYSGTMAIAREATFWGVPAIALSRHRRWTDAPPEVAALGALLRALWDSRTEWCGDGSFLSVNLPAALPATLVQARVGHDKIAGTCDIVAHAPERVVYRVRRERPGTSSAGDESDAVDAGHIAIVRHTWRAVAALPPDVLARWNAALG